MPDQSLGTISALVRLKLTELAADVAAAKATMLDLGTSMAGSMTAAGSSATASLSAVSQLANQVGMAMTAAGAAIVGGMGVAVKVGSDWNEQLIHISANTGMTVAQTADMRKVVEQMGSTTAAPMAKMADGYMHIWNFGFKAADATKILTAATRAAVATGADASKTSELLAGTMLNFGISADQAAQTMNKLVFASSRANATLQEFVASAGHAYAVGHTMGLGLDDINAVLITATQHQYDMALAVTQTIGIMHQLSAPSAKAKEAVDALGAAGVQLKKDLSFQGISRGLANIAEDIVKAAQAAGADPAELASKLAIGQRGGDLLKVLVTNLQQLKDNLKTGEAQTWQFVAANTTLAAKIEILKNDFIAMSSQIATALTPTINQLLGIIQDAVKWFAGLSAEQKETIVKVVALSGVLLLAGGALLIVIGHVAAFVSAITAVIPIVTATGGVLLALTGWLGLIVAGVALLATAWIQDWGHIRENVQAFTAWAVPKIVAAAKEIGAFFGEIGKTVKDFFAAIAHELEGGREIWKNVWNVIVGIVRVAWSLIEGIVKIAWHLVSGIILVGLHLITFNWSAAWNSMKSMLGNILNDMTGMVRSACDAMADAISGMFQNVEHNNIGEAAEQQAMAIRAGQSNLRSGGPSAHASGGSGVGVVHHAPRTAPGGGGGGGRGGGGGGSSAMDALKEKAQAAKAALNEVYESLYKLTHDDFANQRHDALKQFYEQRAAGVPEPVNAQELNLKLVKIQADEDEARYQRKIALQKQVNEGMFNMLEPGRKIAAAMEEARQNAAAFLAEITDAGDQLGEVAAAARNEFVRNKADSSLSDLLGGADLGAMAAQLGALFSKTVQAAKQAREEIESQLEGAIHANNQKIGDAIDGAYAAQKRHADAWKKTVKGMADQMTGIFEGAFTDLFEHGWKSFFKDVLTGFTKMLEQMVAQLLAKAVIFGFLSLFGGGLPGMKSFGSFLGFDDAGNDRQAQHWGWDFADMFSRGVKNFDSQRRPLQGTGATSGTRGTPPITIHMHDVHVSSNMDVQNVADQLGWHLQRRGVVYQGTGQ